MLVHFQNNLKKNRKKRKGKAANSMFVVRLRKRLGHFASRQDGRRHFACPIT